MSPGPALEKFNDPRTPPACEAYPAKRYSAQYRVVWKREGWSKPHKKNYWTKRGAEKLLTLLGDEPWKALGKEPDELYCCNGYMCGCGGLTWREMLMEGRKDFPRLEYARLEQRTIVIGDWEQNIGIDARPAEQTAKEARNKP